MTSWRDLITLGILFLSLYFEVFLLITYFEKRHVMHWRVKRNMARTETTDQELPGVTIIVPCYNEEKTLAKTIHSLLALDYPTDKLHIFAVNDGSTDGTPKALAEFATHPQVQIFHKENGGKHTVLNMGIELAKTDFVGCLDADSYAKHDALIRIMRKFDDQEVMAVVPSLHIYNAKTAVQKMQKVEYLIGVFIRTVLAEINALYVTPGPFSIFRKSVFDKIGYYRKAHNTEDMEMALRMQANNLRIACANDAVIYTSSPHTAINLHKQRVRWTSGFLANVKDYRRIMFNKKHGHVGNFVLPLMIVSTVSIIFIAITFFYDIGRFVLSFLDSFKALGMKMFEFRMPTFSWFYTGTSPLMLASLCALIAVIAFIIVGAKLSKGNKPKVTDVAWYVALYSLIAPTWIIRSVVNVIFNKQTIWR